MEKTTLLLFACLCSLFNATGQNNCDPVDNCIDAPLICGYELENNIFNNNVPFGGGFPANCGIDPHNAVWFKIIPCENTLELFINTVFSQTGDGLQAALFPNCSGGGEIACDPGSQNGAFTPLHLVAPVIPGVEYWLMIDGYIGDICDFEIDVIQGLDTNPPSVSLGGPFSGFITGPTTGNCSGIGAGTYTVTWPGCSTWSNSAFSCAGASCTCIHWQIPPGAVILGDPCDYTVTIDFSGTPPGTYVLQAAPECLCGQNLCDQCGPICCPVDPVFLVIHISAPQLITLPEIKICHEDEFPNCVYEPGGIVGVDFAWCQTEDAANCLIVRQPYRRNPPIIANLGELLFCDTIWICGVAHTQPGFFTETCTSFAGCDSTVAFTLKQDPNCVPVCAGLNLPAPPGDSCHISPFLCGNYLDQYCGSNAGLTDDSIGGTWYQNAGFIRFMPCSDSIVFKVGVNNCSSGSTALSFDLFEGNCTSANVIPGATIFENQFNNLTFTNLATDTTYTFLISGVNNSECAFSIEVLEGIGTAEPGAVTCTCTDGYIDGPATICPGDLAVFSIVFPECSVTVDPPVGGNGYFCDQSDTCSQQQEAIYKLVWHLPQGLHFVGDSTGIDVVTTLDSNYMDLDTMRSDSVWVSWELVSTAPPGDSLEFCTCNGGGGCTGIIKPAYFNIFHEIDYEYCVLTCVNPVCHFGGITFNTPGHFVIDIDNCHRLDATIVMNIFIPVAPPIPPQTICQGATAVLSTPDSGPNFGYLWSTGQTGNSINVSPSNTTTYTITVVNQTNGCTATAQTTVTVIPVVFSNLGQVGVIDCNQSCVDFMGQTYCQPGVYTIQTGPCASIQFSIGFEPPIISNIGQLLFCDTVWICGEAYTEPGFYATYCISASGCDSIVNFSLKQDPDCTFTCLGLNQPAPPGDSCHISPFLCGNYLEQYCGSNAGLSDDILGGTLYPNAGFIRFMPCADSIVFRVGVSNCTAGSTGLSFDLFEGKCPAAGILPGATIFDNAFDNLTFTNLTADTTYTLLISGVSNSECAFSIQVLEGIGTAEPGAVTCTCTDGYIDGPATICPGDLAVFSIVFPNCTATSGPPIGGNGYFCDQPDTCQQDDIYKLVWHLPQGLHFVGDSTGNSIVTALDSNYMSLDTMRTDSVWVSWEFVSPAPPADTLLFCDCNGISCAGVIGPAYFDIFHDITYEYCTLTCVSPSCEINGVIFNTPGHFVIDIDNCHRLDATIEENFNVPFVFAVPPQTICEGTDAVLTVLDGGIPFWGYSWNVGVSGTSITVAPNVTTTYTVIVTDFSNGCTSSAETTVTVLPFEISDLGQVGEITCSGPCVDFMGQTYCQPGVYTVQTGQCSYIKFEIGFEKEYLNLGVVGTITCAQNCVQFEGQNYCQAGNFTVEDACFIKYFSITENLAIPACSAPSHQCLPNNTQFTVAFSITGQPPFKVNSELLGGSDFLSAPMFNGTQYAFIVEQDNGCQTVVSGNFDCASMCVTDAGAMSSATLNGCAGQSMLQAQALAPPVLSPGDVAEYWLQTANGTVLEQNTTGLFSFDPVLMTPGQLYFVRRVVGHPGPGGHPNFADACTDSTAAQPLVFHALPAVAVTGDTSICGGNTLVLYASGADTYQWEDGSTANTWSVITPLIFEPVVYGLTGANEWGCTQTASIEVEILESPVLNEVIVHPPLCTGEETGSIEIKSATGGNGALEFALNSSSFGTEPSFTDLGPGNYTLSVQDAYGCMSDSTFSLPDPAPASLDIGPDQKINIGETITITAAASSAPASIQWSADNGMVQTGDLEWALKPLKNTLIHSEMIDSNGCKASDEAWILVEIQDGIYRPNVMMPDAVQGENRHFTLYAAPGWIEKIVSLSIYDRWGEQVWQNLDFPANAPNLGWDGTQRGSLAAPGVYVYLAVVELATGDRVTFKGDVTLLR